MFTLPILGGGARRRIVSLANQTYLGRDTERRLGATQL